MLPFAIDNQNHRLAEVKSPSLRMLSELARFQQEHRSRQVELLKELLTPKKGLAELVEDELVSTNQRRLLERESR